MVFLCKSYWGRSGLVVTCLTAMWEDQGSNPTMGSCRFFVKTTTIYGLWHGLHAFTAVPRSTQPSTLCGMVKWVSTFGLSNNNNGGCDFWQPTGGLTARVVWPGLRLLTLGDTYWSDIKLSCNGSWSTLKCYFAVIEVGSCVILIVSCVVRCWHERLWCAGRQFSDKSVWWTPRSRLSTKLRLRVLLTTDPCYRRHHSTTAWYWLQSEACAQNHSISCQALCIRQILMLATHSQESCTWNLHKFLVPEPCSRFWCKFLSCSPDGTTITVI